MADNNKKKKSNGNKRSLLNPINEKLGLGEGATLESPLLPNPVSSPMAMLNPVGPMGLGQLNNLPQIAMQNRAAGEQAGRDQGNFALSNIARRTRRTKNEVLNSRGGLGSMGNFTGNPYIS